MADIDVVAENLAELLTNTVDMAAVFYDIFLNPQPLDINIQMYDDNNQLITVTIPNRAKDRITPYVGEGSPEGVVEAPIGAVYVDTLTSTVYYKVSGSDSYGWNAVISQSLMETFIRTYLEARGYITTSSLNTYLITHEYVNIPSLETYLNVNGYIRGKNLDSIPALDLDNKLMVVTEDETDFLKNVSFGNLITSAISSDENNILTRGVDNKLYVEEVDTGVTPGTYQYPRNMEVNAKGKVTSVEQGSVEDFLPSQVGQDDKFLQTNGTSTSWVDILPAGFEIYWPGDVAPNGWLVRDGSAISRTTYSKLFSAIGTKYGAGDGSTTFNLPNDIDRYVKGSTTSGTYLAAGLPDHQHTLGAEVWRGADGNTQRVAWDGGDRHVGWATGTTSWASASNSIYGASPTVQPPTVTKLPIIKY